MSDELVVLVKRPYTNPDPLKVHLKTDSGFDGTGLLTRSAKHIDFTLKVGTDPLKFDGTDNTASDEKAIAKKLRVKPGEVLEMQQRMEGRDLSLDAPMGEDGGSSHVDFVMDGADLPDAELAEQEERHIVQERVMEALGRLDPRERYIIEMRVMQDKPMTLKELGEHFGFSRERARQLEIRAKAKLETELGALMQDLFPGEDRREQAAEVG